MPLSAHDSRRSNALTPPGQPLIPCTKHVLANGLELVLHEDHTEPVVAVYVYYHVGSSREEEGRSGFAHLFEHMLFQGSANVQGNDHFRLIQEAGGTLNGTTNQDRTNYFETLPSHQLELALWLESDRMGFLLPAMTQAKLDNQRDVVMNERRQSYENRPYGLVHETMLAALYPPRHPYSWPTIGSMADIQAATLADIERFFRRYYGPNNATLAIGGDFHPQHARDLVERYFGGLPPGPAVERPAPERAGLPASRRLVLEDRVRQAQLTLSWPTVAGGHPDEAALDLLVDVLSANKSSVLDKALMIDEQLASMVTIAHVAQERAGTLTIQLRPNPGVTLTRLEQRLEELLAGCLGRGIDAARLERLKQRRAGELFRSLETVAARTGRLAHDHLFYGDPGHLAWELEQQRAVSAADVLVVLERYVLGRAHVVLSVVPRGEHGLAAAERTLERARVAAVLDRTAPPACGEPRAFRSPPILRTSLANGVTVLATPFDRVPLTRLSLALPAGRAYEPPGRRGLASLTAEMLEQGTRALASTELTDAFDGLGAQFSVGASDEEIVLRLSVLDECLPRALELMADVLIEPRFAADDFERERRARLVELDTRGDRIQEIADDALARLVFGAEHPRGSPQRGERACIAALTLEEVRAFWHAHAQPGAARLCVVGAQDEARLQELWRGPAARWSASAAAPVRRADTGAPPARGIRLYLIDKPGAGQSELRLAHRSVASTDPDFYPLQALNTILGGSFSSRINMNLREDKGYTYGARSSFEGGLTLGLFSVAAAVETRVTAEAIVETLKELDGIHGGVRAEECAFARKSLSQALARSLESTHARLVLLENVARYGYPFDVLERRLAWLAGLDVQQLDALARAHVHARDLVVLVVGNRAEILAPLQHLGLGEVRELDPSGALLAAASVS